MTDRDKKSTSYRLTPECLEILDYLAENNGITRAGVIEILARWGEREFQFLVDEVEAIREKAEREATQ